MERRKDLNLGLREHWSKSLIPQKIDEVNVLWRKLFHNYPALKINAMIYANLGKRNMDEAAAWKTVYLDTMCNVIQKNMNSTRRYRVGRIIIGKQRHHDGNITLFPKTTRIVARHNKATRAAILFKAGSIAPMRAYNANEDFHRNVNWKLLNPYNTKAIDKYYQEALDLMVDYQKLLIDFDKQVTKHVGRMEKSWIVYSKSRNPLHYPDGYNQMKI